MSEYVDTDPCACTLLWFTCKACNGTGVTGQPPMNPDYCPGCGGSGEDFYDVSTLFVNILVALVAEAGRKVGVISAVQYDHSIETWRPGCGRPAP